MPTKKKATKKAEPKAKPESVITDELNVPSEPQEESVPDFTVIEDQQPANHKKLVGNSKIWANPLQASQNKSVERHFFLEPDEELGLGTRLYNDEDLKEPFWGSDGYIAISATQGENNLQWSVCKIDSNGYVVEFMTR